MSGSDLERLIAAWLDGRITASDSEALQQRLLESAAARATFRQFTELDAAIREVADVDGGWEGEHHSSASASGMRQAASASRVTKVAWPMAVTTVAALLLVLAWPRPSLEPAIATVTGLSGPLQWTGDGGRVFHNLQAGAELPGGTVEGHSPESWFELTFNDGSTVTITGDSMLTFSEHGQKRLHLKAGNLSGDVQPQPPGRPMIVHTRSAVLEVLGTQFGVEAEPWSTVLNVSEGTVRLKRLSDGSTVDVPARHRVVAAAGRKLSPALVPESVYTWRSQLHRGPDNALGEWIAAVGERKSTLRTVPFSTPEGSTIFAAGLGVSTGDHSPVVLQPDSLIRVRGRIGSSHEVYFGVTVRQTNGEFAGRFQTIRPAAEFPVSEDFEVTLSLTEFTLDPSLESAAESLPDVPDGLVVESIWSHTLFDPAELELMEVELVASAD